MVNAKILILLNCKVQTSGISQMWLWGENTQKKIKILPW